MKHLEGARQVHAELLQMLMIVVQSSVQENSTEVRDSARLNPKPSFCRVIFVTPHESPSSPSSSSPGGTLPRDPARHCSEDQCLTTLSHFLIWKALEKNNLETSLQIPECMGRTPLDAQVFLKGLNCVEF